MKEVTRDEFYATVGNVDAVVNSVGDYPYTSEYRMRISNKLIGKAVNREGRHDEDDLIVKQYYLTT
jgi:hypothetical protein